MLSTYKTLTRGQYVAALNTLGLCIDACPETSWDQPVCDFSFRHVAYHTLFFADLYLSGNEARFRTQDFHAENAEFFGGYDELNLDSGQSTPDRESIKRYLAFCLQSAHDTVEAETEESLQQMSEFAWLDITRAENHIYNIRHIHHHAAQLSLRLRLSHGIDIPWVRSM